MKWTPRIAQQQGQVKEKREREEKGELGIIVKKT